MRHRDRVAEHHGRILEIAARYGATNVRVFGSVATGSDGPGSDIDFLVDFPAAEGSGPVLLAVGGLGEELTELLGVRVDVATVELLRPELRADALRTATPL